MRSKKNKKRPASEYFIDVQRNQDKKMLTHRLIQKNIYLGNKLLLGIVMVVALLQFLITSIT